VAVGPNDVAVLQKERAGHLQTIPRGQADPMTMQDSGLESSENQPRTEELGKSTTFETERAIEDFPRIANAGNISEPIRLKELRRHPLVRHMNQADFCSSLPEQVPLIAKVRERFTAECATEMTKKDDERRLPRTKIRERVAVRSSSGGENVSEFAAWHGSNGPECIPHHA